MTKREATTPHPVTEACTHDWHISDYVIDTFPETRFRKCLKCGAEEETNWGGEWGPTTYGSVPPVSPATPPQPMPLTATERSAFLGLQAQARECVHAINEQERAINAEIEARLGLDAGAIGTSFTIDPGSWRVVPIPTMEDDPISGGK